MADLSPELEREACAQIADREARAAEENGQRERQREAHNIAAMIRARGKMPSAENLKFTDTEMLEWLTSNTDFGLFCQRYNTSRRTSNRQASLIEWRQEIDEAMRRYTPPDPSGLIGSRPFGWPKW